jgi:hypothetical protein
MIGFQEILSPLEYAKRMRAVSMGTVYPSLRQHANPGKIARDILAKAKLKAWDSTLMKSWMS